MTLFQEKSKHPKTRNSWGYAHAQHRCMYNRTVSMLSAAARRSSSSTAAAGGRVEEKLHPHLPVAGGCGVPERLRQPLA